MRNFQIIIWRGVTGTDTGASLAALWNHRYKTAEFQKHSGEMASEAWAQLAALRLCSSTDCPQKPKDPSITLPFLWPRCESGCRTMIAVFDLELSSLEFGCQLFARLFGKSSTHGLWALWEIAVALLWEKNQGPVRSWFMCNPSCRVWGEGETGPVSLLP